METDKLKGKEGLFKMINDSLEEITIEQLIIRESWRKQKARLQEQYPNSKVKYSYKTKQFTIEFGLPQDFKIITDLQFI